MAISRMTVCNTMKRRRALVMTLVSADDIFHLVIRWRAAHVWDFDEGDRSVRLWR